MSVLLAAAMLVEAGALDLGRIHHDELDEYAMMIVEACGYGPQEPPSGRECLAATVAVWAVETRDTFSPYPKARSGCGPMQVIQPRSCFGNSRLKRQCAPPCETMRIPRIGIEWGVRVFRWKRLAVRTMERAFGRYNASSATVRCRGRAQPRWRCYMASAHRKYKILLEVPAQ